MVEKSNSFLEVLRYIENTTFMKLSNNGLVNIKRHEGLRLHSYLCTANRWTIGYGHTKTAKPNMSISYDQAESLLRSDVSSAVAAVNKHLVLPGIPLNQSQFDALVSLVFNLGSHNIFTKSYDNGYKRGSTLFNKLLYLDYSGAANRFTDFYKSNGRPDIGLLNRRRKERAMFLS